MLGQSFLFLQSFWGKEELEEKREGGLCLTELKELAQNQTVSWNTPEGAWSRRLNPHMGDLKASIQSGKSPVFSQDKLQLASVVVGLKKLHYYNRTEMRVYWHGNTLNIEGVHTHRLENSCRGWRRCLLDFSRTSDLHVFWIYFRKFIHIYEKE